MILLDGSRFHLYLDVFIGNLVVFSASLSLTWTSPVLQKLATKENPLGKPITQDEEAWISASLPLGAACCSYFWAYLSDKIGRKKTVLCMSAPLSVAYLVLAFADQVKLYYLGRFLAGLSLGGLFLIIPLFVSEISEDCIRGTLSSTMIVFVTLSTMASYCIGPYTSIEVFSLVCFSVTVVSFVLFALFVGESPFYLVEAERYDEAENSLMKYRSRSSHFIQNELNIIKSTVNLYSAGKMVDLFKYRSNLKALLITLGLMFFQQLSGINVILFYAQTIFEATGSTIPSDVSSIMIGLVSFIASFGASAKVDKWGRKILLIVSSVGTFVSELILGVYFFMKDDDQNVDAMYWMPIVCLVAYIFIYNIGLGPLPWTVLAEVFPENIKNKACAFVNSFNWLLTFLLCYLFNSLTRYIGMAGNFWFFAAFNATAALFVAFVLPETKGKSFQEIHDILNV